MKILLRQVMTWLLLVAAMMLLRLSAPPFAAPGSIFLDPIGETFAPADPDSLGAATTLAFILVGSWLTGLIFKRFHLPKITGYLLFGFVFGPSFMAMVMPEYPALLPEEQLDKLELISDIAIALIGLTAGGEIRFGVFKKGFGSVLKIIGTEMPAVFLLVFGALFLLHDRLTLFDGLPMRDILVIMSIVSVISIANSPAIVVVMLVETQAKGPMSEMGLTVTVVKDLCLVVLFTIATAIGVSIVTTEAAATGPGTIILHLAWHLLGSIGAGVFVGAFLAAIINQVGKNIGLLIIGVALGIALVSEAVGFEPMLVSLAAGFVLANLWPERTSPLFHSIEQLSLPVYCVFFAAAGASIDIEKVLQLWPVALLIISVRATAVWAGTTAGAKAAKMPGPARRWLWTMFIPQAGVTIALTASVQQTFADVTWAPMLNSLLLSMIAIHELIGPLLMRYALARTGELER